MPNESGFGNYVKKDAKLEEEVKIGETLIKLKKIVPIFNLGFDLESMAKGSKGPMELVNNFVDHPDRVQWLNDFLKESKDKMGAVLPEGVTIDTFDGPKWKMYKDGEPRPNNKEILKVAQEIRKMFTYKMWSFSPDGQETALTYEEFNA